MSDPLLSELLGQVYGFVISTQGQVAIEHLVVRQCHPPAIFAQTRRQQAPAEQEYLTRYHHSSGLPV